MAIVTESGRQQRIKARLGKTKNRHEEAARIREESPESEDLDIDGMIEKAESEAGAADSWPHQLTKAKLREQFLKNLLIALEVQDRRGKSLPMHRVAERDEQIAEWVISSLSTMLDKFVEFSDPHQRALAREYGESVVAEIRQDLADKIATL